MISNCNLTSINSSVSVFFEYDGHSYDITEHLVHSLEYQSVRGKGRLVAPLGGSRGDSLKPSFIHAGDEQWKRVIDPKGKNLVWKVIFSDNKLQWKITGHLSERPFRINFSPQVDSFRSIFIVYFFNARIADPNAVIFRSQLTDLLKSGILTSNDCSDVSLHIVVTAKRDQVSDLMQYWQGLIESTDIAARCPQFSWRCYFNFTEQFEYPGIRKAWELSRLQAKPCDLVLYFHGKGASHRGSLERNERELFLLIA